MEIFFFGNFACFVFLSPLTKQQLKKTEQRLKRKKSENETKAKCLSLAVSQGAKLGTGVCQDDQGVCQDDQGCARTSSNMRPITE